MTGTWFLVTLYNGRNGYKQERGSHPLPLYKGGVSLVIDIGA